MEIPWTWTEKLVSKSLFTDYYKWTVSLLGHEWDSSLGDHFCHGFLLLFQVFYASN